MAKSQILNLALIRGEHDVDGLRNDRVLRVAEQRVLRRQAVARVETLTQIAR